MKIKSLSFIDNSDNSCPENYSYSLNCNTKDDSMLMQGYIENIDYKSLRGIQFNYIYELRIYNTKCHSIWFVCHFQLINFNHW